VLFPKHIARGSQDENISQSVSSMPLSLLHASLLVVTYACAVKSTFFQWYLSLDMLQKGLKSVDIEQNDNKNNGTDGV